MIVVCRTCSTPISFVQTYGEPEGNGIYRCENGHDCGARYDGGELDLDDVLNPTSPDDE